MARIEPLGNWHYLVEGMEASPQKFYDQVVEALKRREIPDAQTNFHYWQEGGKLSAYRQYLRVTRGPLMMDICGAPFGKGFFFSWWLGTPRPLFIIPTIVALVIMGVIGYLWLWACALIASKSGHEAALGISFLAFTLWPIPHIILFVLLGLWLERGGFTAAPYFLAIPILGWLWKKLFLIDTYYRIDTQIMYQTAVHAAVMEVIDSMTKAQNLERITDDARKPIMRDLFKR